MFNESSEGSEQIDMLTIQSPEIVQSDDGVRLQSVFEMDGRKDILWYEVDEKYRSYLTDERVDAFVVGLFLLAMKKGYDIQVVGSISKRLFYTLNMYLLPLTAEIRKLKPIKIYCDQLESDPLPNGKAVATGLTCGVDTFSTICSHLEEDCPDEYKITHFTFFNVGSHGMLGGDKARALFKKRLNLVKPCAKELGKEVISIDSNISEILLLKFDESHTYRHIAAALVLQKLFNVYYYSSAYALENFTLDATYPAYYDIYNVDMLSTEHIKFYSSNPYETRVDKTRLISQYPLAQKYLNVCIRERDNCGKCKKCLRTLLTLEVIGKLEKFSSIFNLDNYYQNRKAYIAKVLGSSYEDIFKREILDEIRKRNFKVPVYSRLAKNYLKMRRLLRV